MSISIGLATRFCDFPRLISLVGRVSHRFVAIQVVNSARNTFLSRALPRLDESSLFIVSQ